jgi:hypothetical protein
MKWIKKIKIPDAFFSEACLVAGFLMLGYGIYLIFQPAAFIICGSLLLLLGLPPRRKGGD